MNQRQRDADLLGSFIERWPARASCTTRGLQVQFGLPDLETTERVAEDLVRAGLLTVERVGETRLWSPSAHALTAPAFLQ